MEKKDESLKLVDKILNDLKDIELLCSEYLVREKIKKLVEFIEGKTAGNKEYLSELIYDKVKETKSRYPEFHTSFYMLYRKLKDDKISTEEAQSIYEMYVKELSSV